MKYYLLLLAFAVIGFPVFIFMNRDTRVKIIKASKFTENQQMLIGDLFNKNFGRHEWIDSKNHLGKPSKLFRGIILKQDSLRLNGAQINFDFLVDETAGTCNTDSVWWSYPESHMEKKRSTLNSFEETKFLRSLKYLYAIPENLIVKNDANWFACSQPAIAILLSKKDLWQITEQLLAKTPLSIQDDQNWQIQFLAADWDIAGWQDGEKSFAFNPLIQKEIKNIIRNNRNLNQKLNYLAGNHPLNHQDSLKIFF